MTIQDLCLLGLVFWLCAWCFCGRDEDPVPGGRSEALFRGDENHDG